MRVLSPTSRSRKRIYVSLWDLFWALVSPILALYLRDAYVIWGAGWNVVDYWVLSSSFALLAFFAFRLQDGITRYFSVQEALDIAEAVLFAELMTFVAFFTLTRFDGIPRSIPLTHGLLLAAGLIGARMVVRVVLGGEDEAVDYHRRHERVILIGGNRFASSFIQLLKAYAPEGQPVIAVLDADAAMVGRAIAGVQVLGAPHELEAIVSEFAIHGVATNRVVIAGEADFLSPAVLNEVERICKKKQIGLSFLPHMIGITEWGASDAAASSQPVRAKPPFALPAFFRLKRCIDLIGSLVLVVLLSPILTIAGLLVLVDVGRPVFFWQERLGWKGRTFLIYKFRTLRAPFDAAGSPTPAGRRPSAIGRFLRATRIDELPQLLNVLLGDMSLIGPRPLLPEDQPANASVRLLVRPGISGWAQVNGAKLVSKEEKEKLDEFYIRNASLWLDLRIMVKTLASMLKTRVSPEETVADAEQVQSRGIADANEAADVFGSEAGQLPRSEVDGRSGAARQPTQGNGQGQTESAARISSGRHAFRQRRRRADAVIISQSEQA
jgi:lipopolysaccharide/colanic/teichoic acid biosynthesis glycosyltransferase